MHFDKSDPPSDPTIIVIQSGTYGGGPTEIRKARWWGRTRREKAARFSTRQLHTAPRGGGRVERPQ